MSGGPVLSASTRRYLALRRGVELVIVIAAAPLLVTAAALVAAAIRLEGGPVLFRQTRPGRNGRPFTLVKFRTMAPRPADEDFRLTLDDDPRSTRVGRALRRLHLDEIPQLLNVLRGDMALIGPRPVPYELYEEYRERIPNYDWRHVVRPGLIGYAQARLGYTRDLAGERAKWALDVEYVRELSWRVDVRVLLAWLRPVRIGTPR